MSMHITFSGSGNDWSYEDSDVDENTDTEFEVFVDYMRVKIVKTHFFRGGERKQYTMFMSQHDAKVLAKIIDMRV